MTRIGSLPTNNAALNAANNTTPKPPQPEKFIQVTLEFTAEELKIKPGKSMPETVQLSEKRVEDRLFKRFNFDARNSIDMELMKLRLNTNETPHEAIDWQLRGKPISTFPAVRTADGKYQVKLNLSQKTAEQLRGQSFPTAPNAKPLDPNETLAARNGTSANVQRANLENKLGKTSLDGLTPQEKELMLDLLDVGLSVAGIFDPTPISDGAGAGLALSRGDFWGAGINVVGMIPYLGDIAKLGKLPKLVKIIENVVNVAKNSPRFAKAVEGLLTTLKSVLDKVPLDKLPAPLQGAVKAIKNKIDDFFAARKLVKTEPSLPPDPNRLPEGNPKKPTSKDKDPNNLRAITRENESANVLAQNGYRIKQLSDSTKGKVPGVKKPDFEIEGKVFDNYAPSANKPARGIWAELRDKIIDPKTGAKQADRFVVNMNDSKLTIEQLKQQFKDFPLPGLNEIIIIKDGKVVPFFPFK